MDEKISYTMHLMWLMNSVGLGLLFVLWLRNPQTAGFFLFLSFTPILAMFLIFASLCGLFLDLWEKGKAEDLNSHDERSSRYYQTESLTNIRRHSKQKLYALILT